MAARYVASDGLEQSGPVVLSLNEFECLPSAWVTTRRSIMDCAEDLNLQFVVVWNNKPVSVV